MLLVKPTNHIFLFFLFLFSSFASFSQENSPFSRYGLGDLYPQQHTALRSMGGISAAFADAQSINTLNPASYGSIGLVTYDFGITIDSRVLRSASPVNSYKSTNFIPSYLYLGVPLNKKNTGLVFGIRPFSRINYNLEEGTRIFYDSLGISDSLHTVYEGDGGLNQVFGGIGKKWKGKNMDFAVGFNVGYEWGSRNIGTRKDFPADSVQYYQSNSTDTTHFWGAFFSPGIMANFKVREAVNSFTRNTETFYLTIGGYGTFEQKLNATKVNTRETFFFGDAGVMIPVDSISKTLGIEGDINVPLTYTAGVMLTKKIANGPFQVNKWAIGADYTSTHWTQYRYYGLPDRLNDSWFLHVGAQFSADPLGRKGLAASGTYRVGYYTGKDYINADGNGSKVYAFTFGYSFNLKRYHSYDKFTTIHTAFEFGKRGSAVNNITENFFRFSLGLSLSDIWFNKRKYD